jgi:hypothetical protein
LHRDTATAAETNQRRRRKRGCSMPRRGMSCRRVLPSRCRTARPAMGCRSREATRGGFSSRVEMVAETAILEAVPYPCRACGTATQGAQDFAAEVFSVHQTAIRLDSDANRHPAEGRSKRVSHPRCGMRFQSRPSHVVRWRHRPCSRRTVDKQINFEQRNLRLLNRPLSGAY